MPQLRHQHQVLAPGQDLIDRGELGREADRLARIVALARNIEPVIEIGSADTNASG